MSDTSPDNLPLDFLAMSRRVDGAYVSGLLNLSPDKFVEIFSGLGALGVGVEFKYESAPRDEALARYSGAVSLGHADMVRFARTRACRNPLDATRVTGAWNGLCKTHENIGKLRNAKEVREHDIRAGHNRMLSTEQKRLMRGLPLAFVSPETGQRSDKKGCELIVASLYDTLATLQGRRDRIDFFERISKRSLLFLMDFTNYYHATDKPIRVPEWEK